MLRVLNVEPHPARSRAALEKAVEMAKREAQQRMPEGSKVELRAEGEQGGLAMGVPNVRRARRAPCGNKQRRIKAARTRES